MSLSAPAQEMVIALAYEVAVLVNGSPSADIFASPVEMLFPVSQEMMYRADSEPSNLLLMRQVDGHWVGVSAEYQGGSPPAPAGFVGQLKANVTSFSQYAIPF